MTTTASAPQVNDQLVSQDRRGSWVPTMSMISTRLMELRRRRGLMITLIVVVIGLPSVFLGIRLILHLADPKTYGAAGGSDIFTGIVAGVLYVFGFIVAAMIGCTAGTSDLADGMFRHLVVTGRSRLALYLARIPAGLAIVVAGITVGFTIVCLVCSFASPTQVSFQGAIVPPGLSQPAFVAWAGAHPDKVVCNFDYNGPVNVPCGPNGPVLVGKGQGQFNGNQPPSLPSPAQLRTLAMTMAAQNYVAYTQNFLAPPISLMVGSGLWLLLEATIGFVVGLGLGSLLGQRTVSVILMIVLEVVLTPLFATARIPYLLNVQRGLIGIATAHLEPNGLSRVFGSGGGPNSRNMLIPETTTVAVIVVCAWLIVWTALGAWRMMTRDA
jgi:hypothetical protein